MTHAEYEEILRGNKLLALFMGGKLCDGGFRYSPSEMDAFKFPNGVYKFEYLNYHSSWEWLIPAWIRFYGEGIDVRTGNDDRIKYLVHLKFEFHKAIDKGEISKAFRIVVEGVKWYNNIKNQSQ